MNINFKKDSAARLCIPLKRRNNYWLGLRILAAIYFICLISLIIFEYSQPEKSMQLLFPIFVYMYSHPIFGVFFYIFGVISLSLLIRPLHLIIDNAHGLIHYPAPILGKRIYYFVEICAVEIEVDMSKVMLHLRSKKIHRIYLKLRNGKNLLIREELKEKDATDIGNQLKEIFGVEIQHLHRVGWSRGKKISLGKYIVEKELSHGGMGKVFLAQERNTRKKVALKVLPTSLATDKNYIDNFIRETKILRKLSHPNIVKIIDVGKESDSNGDIYFYAMEVIRGRSLSELIRSRELTPERSARFALQIALALDYTHKHKIVHRDLKPDNIMVRDDGGVVLIDFGIARDVSKSIQQSWNVEEVEISHYLGTLPYMSPEQLDSRRIIDHRTDIYSLGVTLYEMLVGERAYRGGAETIARHIMKWYPPEPSTLNPHVSKVLDAITMKALEKNKKRRYQTGECFAEDLHLWLHQMPIATRPVGKLRKIYRKIRGNLPLI